MKTTATAIAATPNANIITAEAIVAEAVTGTNKAKKGYLALAEAIAEGVIPEMSHAEKRAVVNDRVNQLKAEKAAAKAARAEEIAKAQGKELEAKPEKRPAPIPEEQFAEIAKLAETGYVAEIARLVEAGEKNPVNEEILTQPEEVFLAWNEEIQAEEPVLDLSWLTPHMKYRGAVIAAIRSGRYEAKEEYKAEKRRIVFEKWEKGAREVVRAALAENPNRDFEANPVYHEGRKIFARYWRPLQAAAQARVQAQARRHSFIEGVAGAGKNAGAFSGKTERKKAAMAERGETPEAKKAAKKAADRARGLANKGGQKKKK